MDPFGESFEQLDNNTQIYKPTNYKKVRLLLTKEGVTCANLIKNATPRNLGISPAITLKNRTPNTYLSNFGIGKSIFFGENLIRTLNIENLVLLSSPVRSCVMTTHYQYKVNLQNSEEKNIHIMPHANKHGDQEKKSFFSMAASTISDDYSYFVKNDLKDDQILTENFYDGTDIFRIKNNKFINKREIIESESNLSLSEFFKNFFLLFSVPTIAEEAYNRTTNTYNFVLVSNDEYINYFLNFIKRLTIDYENEEIINMIISMEKSNNSVVSIDFDLNSDFLNTDSILSQNWNDAFIIKYALVLRNLDYIYDDIKIKIDIEKHENKDLFNNCCFLSNNQFSTHNCNKNLLSSTTINYQDLDMIKSTIQNLIQNENFYKLKRNILGTLEFGELDIIYKSELLQFLKSTTLKKLGDSFRFTGGKITKHKYFKYLKKNKCI